MNRRTVIRTLGASVLGATALGSWIFQDAWAEPTNGANWLLGPYCNFAEKDPQKSYSLAYCNIHSGEAGRIPLPFRAHGVLQHPSRSSSVLVLAKNSAQSAEVDLKSKKISQIISAPGNNAFSGHGSFALHGDSLYTCEPDKKTQQGLLRIRNANTYKPKAEFATHGYNCNDVMLIDGGATAVVLHYGHDYPHGGQHDDLRTCITFVDVKSGKLIKKLFADDNTGFVLNHLLRTPDGDLIVNSFHPPGSKDKGLASVYVVENDRLQMLPMPSEIHDRMTDQCFAMALHDGSGILGATCAESGFSVFWDYKNRKFLKAVESSHPYGIVLSPDQKYFLISSFTGTPIWLRVADLEIEKNPPQRLVTTNTSHMVSFNLPI